MPHYANGQLAKVGDLVRGKGYSVRDQQGNLKEISGVVAHITPAATTCNIQVMHDMQLVPADPASHVMYSAFIFSGRLYRANLEYGQCDHFMPV